MIQTEKNSYHNGSALRDLRNELGLSQEQVAKKLGMTSRGYWNWENGMKSVKDYEYIGAKELIINLSKEGKENE
jgi:transcriptional regulator with XRE-family HTH domain